MLDLSKLNKDSLKVSRSVIEFYEKCYFIVARKSLLSSSSHTIIIN